MTIQANFSFYAGEDVALPVTIYEADDVTPQNITGWSISFIVHAYGSSTALITKTVGSGIALTTPLSGLLTVTLLSADTLARADMPPNAYFFKILRTDSGEQAELTTGTFTLLGT